MKTKTFKSFLIAILAAMLPQLAGAYDFMVDGIAYNFNEDSTSVTVTYEKEVHVAPGMVGVGYYDLSGDLVVPSNVIYNGTTYSVTEIGEAAFVLCSALTSVTIPNSVTTICEIAFASCTGLTSVTIGNSVTSIGENAFLDCSGLNSVAIGNSVTSIGRSAFQGCSSLNSILLPNSVTEIGDDAFSGCSGLTSVTIPNSVTSIGGGAFSDCSGLTSVNIPNSVTSIGGDAFSGCSGLTSVNIPNSVTNISNYCFSSCSGLTSVTIPNSVTSIGMSAFYNCSGLTSLTIPNSVTSIGMSAFYNCSGLTSLTIPNSVTSIGGDAFSGCSGLTSVTIGNSVTSIGGGAFSGCIGLTSMVVESDNTKYDSRNNCNAIIETATNTLIRGCKNTVIPNSVTSIGSSAFFGCIGLTSVTIPSSLTSIGRNAFSGCSSLTSITLTGNGAWYPINNMPSINQLKTINIGSGITSLGNFGFTPEVVNCYAETPPACSSSTFSNYDGELHVPTTSIASYFMADYWQNFNNMVNDLTDKITLDITTANLIQWETLALAATVIPENSELVWSTTNPSVATVDENGVVTATGKGECDIFASLASSHDAAYAICHITVNYPEITLALSDENLEMNIGDEQTLTATIVPENTGLNPTWTTSDENVATVVNGKVAAIGEGECDITATVLDKTATCHVTVTNNVTITLNVDNAIIGASQMLTVYPSCSPDVPVELVVTSSDQSVAVARVVNRTNAPALGLKSFPEKGMALAMMEELAAPSESKDPALASTKAIMIVGAQNGTATITVTTADGKAVPAVLELRVVDVDGDRTVTASDITALYSYLLAGDNTFIDTSDVNGDGSVTSADITAIYNLILGN